MGVTMWVQMKLNPAPPDPTQQMIFNWMPLIFTFMLAHFPAGLVIYWAWNNSLSVAQQSVIMHRNGAKIQLWDNLKATSSRRNQSSRRSRSLQKTGVSAANSVPARSANAVEKRRAATAAGAFPAIKAACSRFASKVRGWRDCLPGMRTVVLRRGGEAGARRPARPVPPNQERLVCSCDLGAG